MPLDIRSALTDLEDQKAQLLETISQLSKTRQDLLLPEAVEKLRAEIGTLETKRAALASEIERAKPIASKIVEDASRTASELVNQANAKVDNIIVDARMQAADIKSRAEALLVEAEKAMAAARIREQSVKEQIETVAGTSRELANRRAKIVPLLRSLAAELEREIS